MRQGTIEDQPARLTLWFSMSDSASVSTLAEIESAVTTLPPAEQRTLLEWLQPRMESIPRSVRRHRTSREIWLSRLAERRQRGATGKTGTPIRQLMDELRGD